jgi:hypothetical protein
MDKGRVSDQVQNALGDDRALVPQSSTVRRGSASRIRCVSLLGFGHACSRID